MDTLKLKDGLYWNGILDSELRVFDIIMYTEFGTTYNSYFIDGGEKKAVCESAKAKFWEEYKAELESLTKIEELDYVIVNHTEPDHAGSIEKLLDINPLLTVVGTPTAISFLKEIVNRDFASIAVKDGDSLSLGSKTLSFKVFPNLHWPDTMYTYIEEDKVLITCDSFGSHFAHKGILRSTVTDEEGYWRATKYYFDNILGPFKFKFMNAALDWVEQADIEMICPGHGPVHDSGIPKLLETYREWCAVPEKAAPIVVMPYVSAYGYTAELAKKIAEGIATSAPNAEIKLYDLVTEDNAAVAAELGNADGILLGSPTILQEALPPVYALTLGMFPPIFRGRLASAFGSYGWSGEAVPHLIGRLEQIGCKTLPGLRVRLKPSENDLMDAFDFGYNFGLELMKKFKPAAAPKLGGRKMVKCLVCGEIFDASIEICPVCGAGTDKFVEVASTETDFRKDSSEKFVILGGGPAARHAAEAIRKRNATAGIMIITDESELPYNRPMLTKMMLGDMKDNKLAMDRFDWYQNNNVTLKMNTKVTGINTEDKLVITDKGQYEYDKLIYALGAHCFVAPIKGSDKEHVVTIRNIADCDRVKELLKSKGKQVVCIGGGVMGLEGAWELKKGGCDVTILETAPGLLPKQLDDPASEMLEAIVNSKGIKVVTGAKITEINDKAVVLEDGREFPADIVVMSTGMRGNIEVGKDAGLDIDRLIICDDNMRTSVADIYGCGDCVEVNGEPQAFWAQAIETGRIAGANAAGEAITYDRIPASMAINAFGSSIFSMGSNGKDGRDYIVIEAKDPERHSYRKLYFHRGKLEGVILIGDTSDMVKMTEALARKADFKEFK